MRPGDLEGCAVFIPGGSQGIGLAAAKRFAALGADVALFARRADVLAAAADAVGRHRMAAEQRIVAVPLDVADAVAVHRVLGAAIAQLGAPEILLNCAGRAVPQYFERIDAAQLDETLRINLGGAWHATQAALPHMRARGRGAIVNVASLAGLIGLFGYTDYAASKFALVGFSEALRNEVARDGIRVSVLCPPDTQTPGFDRENRGKPRETHAASAGASVLDVETVADALLDGIARGRFLIIPGAEARFAARMKRFFPGLVMRTLDRAVGKAKR
ncbi:MAG: SDR family NAD(P)-dependent oxidoreductase [Deltaproteobacteria bacterium]|nr:SDR family NAD(P)-dependent oxidoreductase [Deltaproteobacteria bacterium]